MSKSPALFGVVYGRTIELESDPGLPDGQVVTVLVQPISANSERPFPEGLARTFGAWADDEGLDEYLEWCRQQRTVERRPIEP